VPEYDAFGREIGEQADAFGREAEARVAPAEEAAPEVVEVDPGDPEAMTAAIEAAPEDAVVVPATEVSRGAGRTIRPLPAVMVVVAFAGAGIAVLAATNRSDDAFQVPAFATSVFEETLDAPQAATPAAPATPAEAPRGLAEGSLIRTEALAPVLVELRRIGRLRLLRVAADRVTAQLVDDRGRLVLFQRAWDGEAGEIVARAAGAGGGPTVPWSSVRSAVPARIVRRVADRNGTPSSAVDYLVLLPLGDRPQWSAFSPGHPTWTASPAGRLLRRT
jgi:hypothetical protein